MMQSCAWKSQELVLQKKKNFIETFKGAGRDSSKPDLADISLCKLYEGLTTNDATGKTTGNFLTYGQTQLKRDKLS